MLFLLLSFLFSAQATAHGESVAIVLAHQPSPRVQYGLNRLSQAMTSIGLVPQVGNTPAAELRVDIGDLLSSDHNPVAEGFSLSSAADGKVAAISAADDSGKLYGCLELARRILKAKGIPANLNLTEAPAFKLRGPCIGMQKTYLLPGRHAYEYPYTPELFPFFYDKQFWTKYLDFLVDNRFNTLYIWNGHPFASLVKLPDYPYALEVSDDVFQKNQEMFRFIATEADKRGIWVVQMFYNIVVSKPFAEHNHIDTQLAAPTPLVADYTRKSIAEFVKQYPNVGLMFCLGEALQGMDNQIYWCTKVILPGVKDGMAQAHLTAQPPVIMRTHATDARIVMPEALKIYQNLYTEEKFNGESLTTYEPRGVRQQLSLAMSKLGSTHITNIHILANLEPFRYGAQRFIKKCMIAARDRLGARGLHLYPLSYWNWPDSPDIATPPLQQIDRDWIWFEAWGRYAWNPDIDDATDHAYWIERIGGMYGSAAAENILAAYNDSGECAPRLLRRFGITEGNRQTLSLGMTLDELTNPDAYRAFPELWESQSPPGERLGQYEDKEFKHEPHDGETPPQIIEEVTSFAKQSVDEIDAAAPTVTQNQAEFDRLRNDVHCIAAMSAFYCDKANAAMRVLHYNHSHDIADMEQAAVYLSSSLDDYRQLAELTAGKYEFANAMQTGARQIPFPGSSKGKPQYYLWSQVLPRYVEELSEFQDQVDRLKHGATTQTDESAIKPLADAAFQLTGKVCQKYVVQPGAAVFTDSKVTIQSVAPELRGLQGVRFPKAGNQPIEFDTAEPVQILIGYFKSNDKRWLQPPSFETDALAAERGDAEPLIQNAVAIDSLPGVDVYAQNYDAGHHTLVLRGSGSFLVLGVIPRTEQISRRDAHQSAN
jgi:hypothetical protein